MYWVSRSSALIDTCLANAKVSDDWPLCNSRMGNVAPGQLFAQPQSWARRGSFLCLLGVVLFDLRPWYPCGQKQLHLALRVHRPSALRNKPHTRADGPD